MLFSDRWVIKICEMTMKQDNSNQDSLLLVTVSPAVQFKGCIQHRDRERDEQLKRWVALTL